MLALKAMFADVDEGIIREVLQAHSGNEERAVESLLAMTDESFVPEERPGEDMVSPFWPRGEARTSASSS